MSEANLESAQETLQQYADAVQEPVEDVSEVETVSEETSEAESQTEAEVIEAARIRAIAEAQGWRPDGKLGPVEFLEAIPKYSENLVNKLRTAEERIERLSKAVGSQLQRDSERAKAEAKQRLVEATERGDTDAALRAAEELNQPTPQLEQTPTDTQAQVRAWAEKREQAWFRQNPDMAQDAAAFYDAEMRKLGRDDPAEILPIVEKKIRKQYADSPWFSNQNRQSAPSTQPVAAARVVSQARKAPDLSSTGLDPQTIAQYKAMGLTDKDILDSANSMKVTYGR